MFRILMMAACAVVVLCAGVEAKQTPEDAVREIQSAVDACDLPRFEELVAIDLLLDQGIGVLISRMRTANNLPPALSLMAVALQANPGMEPSIRAMLKGELGKLIRYGISSGRLTGHPKADAPPSGMLAPFLADLSTGAKTLKPSGPARKDTSRTDARILPVSIHDAGNGKTYKADLLLVPKGGSWQVEQVANMDRLVNRLEKEAAAQSGE